MILKYAFSILFAAVTAGSLTAGDRLELFAGGGTYTQNVPAPGAKLNAPFGVHEDQNGNLFVVELKGCRLLRIDGRGLLWVVAGTDGKKGFAGDGSTGADVEFNGPHSVAVTPAGEVLVADTWNNRIRKFDQKTMIVSTIAGTGVKGFSGDGGPAAKAQFGGIYCASLDPKGENLYLADLDNRRIRVVNLESGIVRTVAGNGAKGLPKDGSVAVESPLVDPRAAIADDAGRVYVLERGGHALRVVEPDGKIKTLAGTGKKGNSGDGGDALQATMNGPKHLCFDLDGNIIIADTENNVIRKYLMKEKTIVRVAGNGTLGDGGVDGPPLEAQVNKPHGVHVDRKGTLYIADSWNHRVLRIVKTEP